MNSQHDVAANMTQPSAYSAETQCTRRHTGNPSMIHPIVCDFQPFVWPVADKGTQTGERLCGVAKSRTRPM